MHLTPYPLIYCPKGVKKPACCPHEAVVGQFPGKGPDAVTTMVDGKPVTKGGGGKCYGGGYDGDPTGWVKTRAGWWVLMAGRRPQDLIRLQAHPRVRRWVSMTGAQIDQVWQIPVLLEEGKRGWDSALDGIWDGKRYHGGDLAPLQEQLLAVVRGVAGGRSDDDTLRAAVRSLAIAILGVGQWVDEDLLIAGGLLSESVMLGAITHACGRMLA